MCAQGQVIIHLEDLSEAMRIPLFSAGLDIPQGGLSKFCLLLACTACCLCCPHWQDGDPGRVCGGQ